MRFWRILVGLATCGLLASVSAMPAAAAGEPSRADHESLYLAIGDSVAFGFNPLLNFANSDNFVGYPEALARRLDLHLTNASCPGETSGGFISFSGTDNGCRGYRFGVSGVHPPFPLHVNYSSTQLDFAVAFLKSHPNTRLVTLDIGANDLFVLQNQCKGDRACIAAGIPALIHDLTESP